MFMEYQREVSQMKYYNAGAIIRNNSTHFFLISNNFQSQPEVASEILENEAESFLVVAYPK